MEWRCEFASESGGEMGVPAEDVGISLSRSDEAVRIHSVQPLFTAGQCLSDPRERQVVMDLLRGIESDIGWATQYRTQALAEQWQCEEHDLPFLG
jgi:hypothetical protein